MKSNITQIKQRVNALLKELERIEAQELADKDMFPLSELRERVTRYVKENDITIDTFCELAMISKATLYAAFNSPSSTKRATIESIISVFGNYTLYIGRADAS
ncbi:hypothetical protein FM042_05915 [Aliidiomarina halalkaliphila]|uniref:Uncharacterized protein n=1 Tax=Aliidiomarina halalkaliphila TaxID=2593535 RepID=A0A552X5R9_9GAMM|nr:hypothetical protein [Aliidiomarina halalkaliphila]TRW50365.1 hypothetical protein FM042_05915 [Aliidiomarina halalkaliphila]